MEPSIFTRIIRGEISSYKIYEDDHNLAFLDIHPAMPGHTLVVPKAQIDRLEELDDASYASLMQAVRKVMKRVVEVYGADYRACLKLEGFDVPHAHVHVIPCRNAADFLATSDPNAAVDEAALAAEAKKLAF